MPFQLGGTFPSMNSCPNTFQSFFTGPSCHGGSKWLTVLPLPPPPVEEHTPLNYSLILSIFLDFTAAGVKGKTDPVGDVGFPGNKGEDGKAGISGDAGLPGSLGTMTHDNFILKNFRSVSDSF